jgi:hypothetical protein
MYVLLGSKYEQRSQETIDKLPCRMQLPGKYD